MQGGSSESFSQFYYMKAPSLTPKMTEEELILKELEDLKAELAKPKVQKELVGSFKSKWKRLILKGDKSLYQD
jgi:ribosomal protein L29